MFSNISDAKSVPSVNYFYWTGALADNLGIPADYGQLRDRGRFVLASNYASELLHLAKTWSDVVLVVGGDKTALKNAVADWTLEQKQPLVKLLSTYLSTENDAFKHIDWLPKTLL